MANISCGIVGLPNVGKSTLFSALTGQMVQAENYPFCTIDPNIGIVDLKDPRVKELGRLFNSQKLVYPHMKFVDIAGLVKGASSGEGLGNQFLAHIREVDLIVQVVRCFEDPDIVHVLDEINPLNDIQIINMELILSDVDVIDKHCIKLERLLKNPNKAGKEAQELYAVLKRVRAHLAENRLAQTMDLSPQERAILRDKALLTLKPMIFLCNIDEASLKEGGNALTDKVHAYACAQEPPVPVHLLCAQFEQDLLSLKKEEQVEFLESLGLQESGLQTLARICYDELGLKTYFTAGEKETHAWTFPEGINAPEAASLIHTDFQRGFIKAQVYHYDEIVKHKTETALKAAGLLRIEGKQYLVQDGDVLHFRFNV